MHAGGRAEIHTEKAGATFLSQGTAFIRAYQLVVQLATGPLVQEAG